MAVPGGSRVYDLAYGEPTTNPGEALRPVTFKVAMMLGREKYQGLHDRLLCLC